MDNHGGTLARAGLERQAARQDDRHQDGVILLIGQTGRSFIDLGQTPKNRGQSFKPRCLAALVKLSSARCMILPAQACPSAMDCWMIWGICCRLFRPIGVR